jgi:DUF3099 family protein
VARRGLLTPVPHPYYGVPQDASDTRKGGAGDDADGTTAYGGEVRVTPRPRRDPAHLVTQARRPRSEDIAYRERRYLIMMGFRVICFGAAILLFTQGAGWFAAIPAVGALIIPYFAVVFANSGREPTSVRGFREYEPRLPATYTPPGQQAGGPSAPNPRGSRPNDIDPSAGNHNGEPAGGASPGDAGGGMDTESR